MTPYEKLMAEALPTGTFGHARPPKHQRTEPAPAWTPAEQARHRAELDAALNGFELDDAYANNKRDRYREQRAHLQLVSTPPPGTCTCAKCDANPASRQQHHPAA
ncbi:hypothetical protein [Streptomyces chartreusis]|uniref:hypothetical protein n=1 Tax=Streptomyces chartreusis TaxID=1969 RepID=UPI00123C975E|nr:hypothetical protein [Streptomyces chartreusis]QEV66258.1 hypothetical protein CP983_05980 [Streptomyces chartreusis]GGW99022.1 hypothetical protein GCM10010321_11860 [Streptomyces chartreusis]